MALSNMLLGYEYKHFLFHTSRSTWLLVVLSKLFFSIKEDLTFFFVSHFKETAICSTASLHSLQMILLLLNQTIQKIFTSLFIHRATIRMALQMELRFDLYFLILYISGLFGFVTQRNILRQFRGNYQRYSSWRYLM